MFNTIYYVFAVCLMIVEGDRKFYPGAGTMLDQENNAAGEFLHSLSFETTLLVIL